MAGGGIDPHQLMVEDSDIAAAIVALMKARIVNWPQTGDGTNAQVWIKHQRNAPQTREAAEVLLKAQFPQVVGMVVDAESDFAGTWASIRGLAIKWGANVAPDLPATGLVVDNVNGKRFGAWIMPNNQANGMLEHLLHEMIPAAKQPLVEHIAEVVVTAKNHGADYDDIHVAKAKIHAYLALRDPPGQRIGMAISSNSLSPDAVAANAFVSWMANLYGLQIKP